MSFSKSVGLVTLGLFLSVTCPAQQLPFFKEKSRQAQAFYQQGNYLGVINQLTGFHDENVSDLKDRRELHYLLAKAYQQPVVDHLPRAIVEAKAFMATKPSKKDPRYQEMLDLSKQVLVFEEAISNEVVATPGDDPLIPDPHQPLEAKEIYTIAEQMPTPEGGIADFYEKLPERVRFSDVAIKYQVSGTIFVSLVVGEDGSVSELRIDKGLGFGLEEEALRIMQQTRWEPGRQDGKAVAVAFLFPVPFTSPKP